jgi:hypothetical protein
MKRLGRHPCGPGRHPCRPWQFRLAAKLLASVAAAALAGCAQPGTSAPPDQAAKLDVATSRISVACGYAEELTAFPGRHAAAQRPWIESIAVSGARKLASVYARDQSDIYQGESVGAIVNDSISLLHDCGLSSARKVLEQAQARRSQ